jgi:hypothetical protein
MTELINTYKILDGKPYRKILPLGILGCGMD